MVLGRQFRGFRNLMRNFILILVAFFLCVEARLSALHAGPITNDAIVLVNSSSPQYLDFQHFVQPYLDNFGVPYSVLDIASNSLGTNIGSYALIIVGHKQLDTNQVFLDQTAQQNICLAVTN